MTGHILSIDQGTTSSRALVFAPDFSVAGLGQQEFAQHYPQSGWVEHDAEEIWSTTLATTRTAIAKSGIEPRGIAAIGIAQSFGLSQQLTRTICCRCPCCR